MERGHSYYWLHKVSCSGGKSDPHILDTVTILYVVKCTDLHKYRPMYFTNENLVGTIVVDGFEGLAIKQVP